MVPIAITPWLRINYNLGTEEWRNLKDNRSWFCDVQPVWSGIDKRFDQVRLAVYERKPRGFDTIKISFDPRFPLVIVTANKLRGYEKGDPISITSSFSSFMDRLGLTKSTYYISMEVERIPR